jgi:phosphatidylethanolamine/phosphatidyl-N-methylethanolamine N-methyltransferase
MSFSIVAFKNKLSAIYAHAWLNHTLNDLPKWDSTQLRISLQTARNFMIRFFQSPTTVGAIAPSSKWLAEKMVTYIPLNKHSPINIMELGPGTGPFTELIIKMKKDSDRLDLIELDESFCKLLRKKFGNHPNVHIHCVSITDWKPEYRYDAIVSGLPLNSFSPDMVQKIITKLKSLTKNGGVISAFDYPALNFRSSLLRGNAKIALKKVLQIKDEFYKQHGFAQNFVLRNIPPARVCYFRISADQHPQIAPAA